MVFMVLLQIQAVWELTFTDIDLYLEKMRIYCFKNVFFAGS